jgi:hypothetical protein
MFCHTALLGGAMVEFRNSRNPEVSTFFWATELKEERSNPKSMAIRSVFFIINFFRFYELNPNRNLIIAK